jgi:hypothetical protein
MTDVGPRPPGAGLAMTIVHPGSSALRVRYRRGVLIDPYGFPDWTLYARALVELPPIGATPILTVDENRLVAVLAANLALARAGQDPLWTDPGRTPVGWCWAHAPAGHGRTLALVPAELHGSFRHGGAIWATGTGPRGVRFDPGSPLAAPAEDPVPEDILRLAEQLLGQPLPPVYRRYLGASNGAGPAGAAILAPNGFLIDGPLFGLGRDDHQFDLTADQEWVRDRLTPDFLPIGFVQGGLLALKIAGEDTDSIWYLDDDDPRDREGFGPAQVSAHLLQRCADSIDALWAALARPPAALVARAQKLVERRLVVDVRDDTVGASLPPRMRAPWQPTTPSRADPLVDLFEAR